jgi:hypothetical protein
MEYHSVLDVPEYEEGCAEDGSRGADDLHDDRGKMNSIVIGKSEGKKVSLDLDVLLSTRLLLTADSGGGKTFALKRLCEQSFGKLQIIIIDPEGEFSPLRQKYDFVLVGPGGETPADVRSAAMLAVKLLELRASAICDIYDMKPSVRHTWVRLFLEALIEAPKKLRHPCMVIVDEAHIFCPEHGKGESEATDAMKGLCTRGRKRLLCPVFATQRLATLAKDASSMLLNRLIGPTFEDLNRKRAAECLSISRDNQHQFMKDIQLLEPGNFYALGRAITREMKLVRIGEIQTPHGQEAIKYETAPPAPPDKVKALLPKLADLPKEAEEKAKTEAELRGEIRSLKAQLREQPKIVQAKPQLDYHAMKAATQIYQRTIRDLETRVKTFQRLMEGIAKTASNAANLKLEIQPFVAPKIPSGEIHERKLQFTPVREHRTEVATNHPRSDESSNGNKLRAGAERMLAALAQWHPNGMSEGQMRAHAGLRKSGTFSTYLSDLRKGNYIEERGGDVYATERGLEYCQHVPSAPQSTEEVVSIWNQKLRDGARRMLAVLVEAGGEPISKEELGEKSGLVKSGTFSTYLSDLKTARLVTLNRDGTVAANKETLFL